MSQNGVNRKQGKRIEIRLVTIIFVIFVITILSTLPSFARYIYNDLKDLYFTSKEFYFTSNLLSSNTFEYSYANWGGTEIYEIECKLYSYANELLKLDYDLDYQITCTVPEEYRDKIKCAVNSTQVPEGYAGSASDDGTIYCSTNIDTAKIYVIPITTVSEGESVKIQISAKTQSPYQKTISCNIELQVQTQGNSFIIEDEENKSYALLKLTNSVEEETQITLEFDPEELRLDLNDEIYNEQAYIETKTIDGGAFVKKITFTMPKESSKNIKFYKVDKSKNYSYPNGNAERATTISN